MYVNVSESSFINGFKVESCCDDVIGLISRKIKNPVISGVEFCGAFQVNFIVLLDLGIALISETTGLDD